MGCGSSVASRAAAPGAKDPEDFHLEHIDFKKFGIAKFDDFCDDLEAPVNTIVDISNEINGCITDVKDAVALVLGAYRLDIDITDVKDHDKALLSFTKADGTFATTDEIAKLDDKAKAADQALAKARLALYKALYKYPVGLKVVNNVLAPATDGNVLTPEATAFNAALGDLRAAVGAGYTVKLAVAPAAVQGGIGVSANISKPVFKNKNSTEYELEPISVLDVAASKQAKAIFAAEAAVAKACSGVAKALKAMPAGSYKLDIKKRKLIVTMGDKDKKKGAPAKKAKAAGGKEEEAEEAGPVAESHEDDDEKKGEGEGEEDKEQEEGDEKQEEAGDKEESKEDEAAKQAKKEAAAAKAKEREAQQTKAAAGADLKKAASAFNAEVFKLAKASRDAVGTASIGRGLVAVLDAVKDWGMEQIKSNGKGDIEIGKLIKVEPKITTDENGELDFDIGLTISLPDEGDLTIEKLLPRLPGAVQLVYKAVMSIKTRVTEMIPMFEKVKDEVQTLIDSADEVFENPMDTIKEELEDLADPMEMAKMIRAVASNLMEIKNCVTTVAVFINTIQRVAGELRLSFEDLKKAVAPEGAAPAAA